MDFVLFECFLKENFFKNRALGTPQWSRASTAGGMGSIPGWELRPHTLCSTAKKKRGGWGVLCHVAMLRIEQ